MNYIDDRAARPEQGAQNGNDAAAAPCPDGIFALLNALRPDPEADGPFPRNERAEAAGVHRSGFCKANANRL
jgi:hypothetical protein